MCLTTFVYSSLLHMRLYAGQIISKEDKTIPLAHKIKYGHLFTCSRVVPLSAHWLSFVEL